MKVIVIVIRVGIGLLLILASSQKILIDGYPPIVLTNNPVGDFFKCMIDTGVYWKAIGFIQLVVGVLLITQRYATFGALMLSPIAFNVFMITISLYPHFGSTLYLNLVLVGLNIFLLWYDYDKLKFIFWKRPPVV